MTKTLDLRKSVHDLAKQYPDFTQVMVGLGFTDIVKPAALNSVGRIMTVPKGCGIKGIDLAQAVRAFEDAGFEVTGVEVGSEDQESFSQGADVVATPGDDAAHDDAADNADAAADATARSTVADVQAPSDGVAEAPASPAQPLDEAGRAKLLSSYVERLSAGEPLEKVRAEFVANFQNVDAAEIARAEQGLIEGGAKVSDVQRLCDVHSALFHGATREERIANAENAVMDAMATGSGKDDFQTKVLATIPGHPVRVLSLENSAIEKAIQQVRDALDASDQDQLTQSLRVLAQLGVHYAKKGDLIYPILKTRYGFSGPADVMWGVDDEIRGALRNLLHASNRGESWHQQLDAVLTRAQEMTYKEANILLPLCVKNFTDEDWLRMYVDMKGYDLCIIDDAGTWQTGEAYFQKWARHADEQTGVNAGQVKGTEGAEVGQDVAGSQATGFTADATITLPSGSFTPAQLDAMLNTLPVEITFIDDHETNLYWNDDGQKKLFKRPPTALGRKVWDCHPPKAQQMVKSVIAALKSGERDSFDIWMQKQGEPVLVRYMAVRDRKGNYVGTMEVVQRMGFAQEHFSQAGGDRPACRPQL